jgi:hypothetical protein
MVYRNAFERYNYNFDILRFECFRIQILNQAVHSSSFTLEIMRYGKNNETDLFIFSRGNASDGQRLKWVAWITAVLWVVMSVHRERISVNCSIVSQFSDFCIGQCQNDVKYGK